MGMFATGNDFNLIMLYFFKYINYNGLGEKTNEKQND